MKLGDIEWHLVSDGTFRLDGGAMFGVVPKPLWEKKAPPDERNRITLGTNALLIRSGGLTVLVDAGIGRKETGRFPEIYGVGNETDIVTSLAAHGVRPGDVDLVVYTHLHFDHAGGATRLDEDGRAVPVFPNAQHLIQHDELQDAESPTDRSRASYLPDNWEPIREAGLLEVVFGGMEIAPGVSTVILQGHVRSLSAIAIESGNQKVFYPTDNMPTSAHVPPPWLMGYDLYPLETLASKESFLPAALDEGWILAFEHDPVVGAAKVHRAKKGYDLEVVLPSPLSGDARG